MFIGGNAVLDREPGFFGTGEIGWSYAVRRRAAFSAEPARFSRVALASVCLYAISRTLKNGLFRRRR